MSLNFFLTKLPSKDLYHCTFKFKQNKKKSSPSLECVPLVQLARAGCFGCCHGYDGSFHLRPHDDQLHLSRRRQLRRVVPARDCRVLVTEAWDLTRSGAADLFSRMKWREVWSRLLKHHLDDVRHLCSMLSSNQVRLMGHCTFLCDLRHFNFYCTFIIKLHVLFQWCFLKK